MIAALIKLFSGKPKHNIGEIIAKGALILDVRTPQEYAAGHLKTSVNIPADEVQKRLPEIGKNKPIVACCASGMRSGVACRVLRACGYTEVYNGGSWQDLKQHIQ